MYFCAALILPRTILCAGVQILTTTPTSIDVSSKCKLQKGEIIHRYYIYQVSELFCSVNALHAGTETADSDSINSLKYHCLSDLPGILSDNLFIKRLGLRFLEIQDCFLTRITSNALTKLSKLSRIIIQAGYKGDRKDKCVQARTLTARSSAEHEEVSNATKKICSENYLSFPKGILSGNKVLWHLQMEALRLNNSILTEIRELRRLQFLSLRDNYITAVPFDSIAKLTELTTLDISMNEIKEILKGAFKSQYNLKTLDISHNSIYTIAHGTFGGLIRLRELNLAGNQITTIISRMFEPLHPLKKLDVSDNYIELIEQDAFYAMDSLSYLYLNENNISILHNDTFSNLTLLEELYLSDNSIVEVSSDIFIRDGNLKLLDISFNNIAGFHSINVNVNTNDRGYLSSTLEKLFLQNNSIVTIDWSTFLAFPSLKTLDISNNKIADRKIDIVWLPEQLEILNISGNAMDRLKIIISDAFGKTSSLKQLDASHNQISNLSIVELPHSTATGLISFHIGYNPFHCDCNMLWLRNLITLQNGITETYVIKDYDSLYCHSLYRHEPRFMTDINPENFLCEYNTSCPETCTCYQNENSANVNIVDCKNNNITVVSSEMPKDCTVLDLSGNSVSSLEPVNFDEMPQLKELLINQSQVSEIDKGSFRNLSELKKLDLAENQLTVLAMDMFEGLVRLETLDIRFNLIRKIEEGTFQAMKSLSFLDIRGNQLKTISAIEFESFTPIQSLKLSRNPWSCECGFVEIMKRFMNLNAKRIDDFDDITCSYYDREKNMQIEHFLYDVHKPKFCVNDEVIYKVLDQPLIISISVVLAIIIIGLIIFVVVFKNRKFLKLWCFMKFRVRFGYANEINDVNRPYDAFVSYCSKDGRVIAQEIVPRLEEPKNGRQGYKLYVSDRDFPAGGSIAETIIHAVKISKRVLVIVSDNYLKSEWCQYEFRQAHYQLIKERSNRIIMILLEELNQDLIYEEIGHYLKTRTYVKYEDPLVWPKVEYAMPETKAIENNRNQNREDDRVEFIPLEVMSGDI